jgi:drug/metabolite transporter (DMT)-like permease
MPAMSTPPAARDQLLANAGLAVMVLLGGGFFPVLQRTLETWDSLSATAARQVIGGIALCLVLVVRERHLPWLRGVAWPRLLLLNLIGMGFGSVLVSWAVAYSDGVSAAIVSAANPILAALIARLLYRQKMTRAVAIGAVLAVAGGLIAILGDGSSIGEIRGGEILMLGAGALWTWYSIAAQRLLAGQSQLAITALTTVPSGLALSALSLVLGASGVTNVRVDFSPSTLLLLLYAGLMMIGVANLLWHFGVSRVGVTISTMYTNLMPVAAVLVTLWLGTSPTGAQLVGGGIILAGVLYSQLAVRAPAPAARPVAGLQDS